MSGSFLRKSSIHRLLRSHIITDAAVDPSMTATTTIHSIINHQTTQSRASFRFPQFFRKSREFNELSPPFFTSPSSCSSSSSYSSSNAAASFVGWYLAMVKSRPILTKSVTSSLIYVAADFSSQTIAQPVSEPYDLVRTLRMAAYGENSNEIIARLKRDLLPTMMNGVMYWPMCDFITFKFIPVHLQTAGSFLCFRVTDPPDQLVIVG
ncbi:hypothetical protein GH714_032042 [Hevea brasiliensis]|uniref:Uncharacterized protein n=1 Tax=Hevea brasiliensis TaxID=3981 RepID=A0A6A6N6I5_HEVBR|nr:hypothetical protein GH714_032042 [Hevea brasiliensis]